MTPAEALHIMKQTAEKFVGTRQDHEVIARAIQTLADFIAQHTSKADGPN